MYSLLVQNGSLANYKQLYIRVCNTRMKNRGPQRPKPTAADPSTPIRPDLNHGRSEQIQFSLGLRYFKRLELISQREAWAKSSRNENNEVRVNEPGSRRPARSEESVHRLPPRQTVYKIVSAQNMYQRWKGTS